MIDRETVDRIYAAANIVDIIGDYVTLKRKGVNYQACCPFHNEKTPSFVVSPSKGVYKCFGCGKGGNAVTFLMEHENITYPEALKMVAKRYGIEVREKELTEEEVRRNDDRESMFVVNGWAAEYFANFLCHDPEALLRPEASSFHTSGMKPREKPKRGTAVTVTAERAYKIIRAQLEEEGIAYAPGSYNDYVSRCFYHTNRYGVPQADAEAWALRTFPDYPREQLLPIVKSCYSLTMEFNTVPLPRFVRKKEKENDSSHKKATVEEMEEFINGYMKFRMNMLTHQIETQLIADAYTDRPEASACHWQRLTDHIENSLWCAMQHHGMAVNLNELHTLLGSDFVKEYHPLKEYLDGLPPWDGETDYIGRLAAMVHVKESPHSPLQQDKSRERNDLSETPVRFADILKRWMVSMIAAALNETVVNQVILTLIGRQGSYKTSFMQHILPPVLSEYYTTKSNSSRMTKDDLFTMTENLVINLEEIDTMPPSELNQLKAMVTQRYVDERRAYGRNKVHLPHVASFVATGNNLQFLTDDTGNRRWLPFEVEDIARGRRTSPTRASTARRTRSTRM